MIFKKMSQCRFGGFSNRWKSIGYDAVPEREVLPGSAGL